MLYVCEGYELFGPGMPFYMFVSGIDCSVRAFYVVFLLGVWIVRSGHVMLNVCEGCRLFGTGMSCYMFVRGMDCLARACHVICL